MHRILGAGVVLFAGFALYPGIKDVCDTLVNTINTMFPSLPTFVAAFLDLSPIFVILIIFFMAGWLLFGRRTSEGSE